MDDVLLDPWRELVQVFALAIVNATAYNDLLRVFQAELRKMSISSVDSMLFRVWSVLQALEPNHPPQNDENDWLVSYLEFATAVFR